MKNNRIIWGLVSLFVMTILAITIGTMSGHSQQDTSKSDNFFTKIKKNFPSVEYPNTEEIKENVNPRSKKYSEFRRLNPDTPKDVRKVSFIDWITTTLPLPVTENEVVVLGKVVDAKAHLSGNKKSVYSEFKIEIEKIFKDNSHKELLKGKYIQVEREGGIVRYPTGKETWYLVSGQQMPKVGSRYVFFLTHNFPLYGFQKEDLFLFTAYELKDGKVFPLDNPNGDTHPIATFYKGKEESVLFSDLVKVLENSTGEIPK